MCGIAGILDLDGQQVSLECLQSMIALLRHRGPDAMEIVMRRGIGLAHARLSIIDLTNGRQPMRTEDGSLTVTFNGEIFNYIELRAELIHRGHSFRTQSDTEVILHAYEEYGAACVEHFNGQWAFALWDQRRGQLFLSRDRLGIRPLFYTRAGNRLLFASEIKSLFMDPGVRRELDPRGMNQLFTFWSTLAPTTVFRDICELPPGHNLIVRHGSIEEQVYWQINYPPVTEWQPSDAWAEELRALLTDATRIRLRADVPVGAYLSGGLDSSLTTALAKRNSAARLRTFSIAFDHPEFDESPFQQSVAESLAVEHHTMRCTPAAIARIFPDVVWHTEKPLLRTAPAPLFMLSERVHDSGLKVVLTGEGADEMLGGYDVFKEAKIRRFYARNPDSAWRAGLFERLYPYLPGMQAQSAAMRRAFFRARPEDLASPLFSHLPRWETTGPLRRFFSRDFLMPETAGDLYRGLIDSLPREFSGWSPFCQAQYLESSILLPGYILSSQGDRMAMACSVEGRYPFLDHRLAEFASRVPPRLKMHGLNEKHLLKRALGDLIPPSIAARTKQPYRAPDAMSFFPGDGESARQEYVEILLSRQRVKADGIFQPDAVARLASKIRYGRAGGMRDNMAFVGILSTQLLIEQFLHRPREPQHAACWIRLFPEGFDSCPADSCRANHGPAETSSYQWSGQPTSFPDM